ncbi:putative glycoside hydrolase [Teredinibacter haidensis]|uniref:putative glycoside hydrolase n=1 Tax=Teredinibacter haidensis TaxID=2731755 RepID=UPI00094898B9|nr:putative glycoside hydrolase [Teredinibacter haidensis]
MTNPHSRKKSGLTLLIVTTCLLVAGIAYAQSNPAFSYFVNGQLIGDWQFQLGDPGNWSFNIEDKRGKSQDGKVEAYPDNFQADGDAIRGVWSRKKMKGELKVVSSPKNISSVRDITALTFDFKINQKANKDVAVTIDCGYPCRASVNIGRKLRKKNKGEWFTFPIPLNCFDSDNFDLTKVNGISVSTEGKFDLSIGNIRLQRLPEGERGCAGEK